MDNMQFCYWLKGYFEIGEVKGKTSPYLNSNQIDVVRDHIELVSMNNAWLSNFIQWLQGVIDASRILKVNNTDYVNLSRVIKVKLDDVFEKKTPDRAMEIGGDLLDPPRFPPLFVPPGATCSPDEALDLSDKICWEDNLRTVLQRYPGAGGGSGKVFCAKED